MAEPFWERVTSPGPKPEPEPFMLANRLALTVEEAAQVLGLSERTVRDWLPAFLTSASVAHHESP